MTQIDFHSHILPGLDHGCRNVETSLAQLALIGAGGTQTVVASSHFYPERMNLADFTRHRSASVQALAKALPAVHPNIIVGAEVACYPGLHHMEGLEELCVAGTDCLLLEMPLARWNDALYETVDGILDRGIRVILAHIDRYVSLFSVRQIALELAQLPVYVQANADSFVEFPMSQCMLWMLRNGMIHLLGSDCHNTGSRAPNLSAAINRIEKKLGNDAVMHICTCQQEILSR